MPMSRRAVSLVALACGLAAILPATAAAKGGAAYMAGAAVADINPTYPVYMGGYGGGPAGGTIARHLNPITHRPEDFTVRAIAIGAGAHVDEFATVDTQGYFAGYQEGPYGISDVRRTVAAFLRDHGAPSATPANLIISSEHEHAAPTLLGIWGPPQHQLPYLKQVAGALTRVLERAYLRMRPATITWGQGNAPWVADRVISEGNAFEGWPRDGSLGVLWARDARTGATIATYVSDPGYPNIVYGPGDLLGHGGKTGAVLSSDFPNYADSYISERLGGVAIVTDGTLGNQTSALQTDDAPSPDLPRENGMRQTRAFDDIVHMGQLFAQLTLSALAHGHRLGPGVVEARERYLSSPVYNPILIADDKIYSVPGGGNFLTAVDGGALYPIDRSFNPPYGQNNVELSTWVTAFRIGDLLFTTMPGEFFPSTHAAWLQSIKGPAGDFVIGAAQDFLGYEYPVYAYPFTFEGSDEGIFNPSLTLGDQVVTAGEQDANALGFHANLLTSPEYTALQNQYLRQFSPGVQFIPFPQSGDLGPGGTGFAPTIEGISQPPRDTTTQGACLADTYVQCPFPPPPMGSFRWRFGDGTSAVTPPQAYARAYYSPFIHHRFCRAGTYRVTVTAASPNGGSDSMTLPVVVHPQLALRIRSREGRLRVSARGGTGRLLYVSWRARGRVGHGASFRAPFRSGRLLVTGVDGTGTTATYRVRLHNRHLVWERRLAAAPPPLSAASAGRCQSSVR
jgi:hypothetical protein